jgi:hypothetical protein
MAVTGRPTKLTAAIVKAAAAYLKQASGDRTELPTIEGLALALKISRDTVYEWSKAPEEGQGDSPLRQDFSDIVSDLKNAQANKLMQNGLKGTYNATIAKLILSGKHGYVEKSEVDQTVSGNVSFVNDVPRPEK